MAFLINAYNAFTVEMILTRYPDLKSIRDLGSFFGEPVEGRSSSRCSARESYLDGIEHEMLRKPGAYDEPRVHFAVNCASIGCPMLREEAYVAERLDAQLEEQARRFLSDRTRNRFDPQTGSARGLEDLRLVQGGLDLAATRASAGRPRDLARAVLRALRGPPRRPARGAGSSSPRARRPIGFLDYDWSLNDATLT